MRSQYGMPWLETIFRLENADDERRPILAEMVAKHAFDLAAELFSEPDDLWFFCNDCNALTAKDSVSVVTDFSEKALRGSPAGHGNVNIGALIDVEDSAADYFAVLLYAETGQRWVENDAYLRADEIGHPRVSNDQEPQSAISKL